MRNGITAALAAAFVFLSFAAIGQTNMTLIRTTTKLIDELPVGPAMPYLIVAQVQTGPVTDGQLIQVFGESHGNPQQNQQLELAWVTGIAIYAPDGTRLDVPCTFRGRDLLKSKKHDDARVGAYVVVGSHDYLTIKYEMRALNTVSGGKLIVSWVTLGVIL